MFDNKLLITRFFLARTRQTNWPERNRYFSYPQSLAAVLFLPLSASFIFSVRLKAQFALNFLAHNFSRSPEKKLYFRVIFNVSSLAFTATDKIFLNPSCSTSGYPTTVTFYLVLSYCDYSYCPTLYVLFISAGLSFCTISSVGHENHGN